MTVIRRLGFLIAFVAILMPVMVVGPATVLAAGIAWLCGANEAQTDKILLNPALMTIADFPFKILGAPQ